MQNFLFRWAVWLLEFWFDSRLYFTCLSGKRRIQPSSSATSHGLFCFSSGSGAKWSISAAHVPSCVLVRSDDNEPFIRRCLTLKNVLMWRLQMSTINKRHEDSLMKKLLNAIILLQCWVNYGGLRHLSSNECVVHQWWAHIKRWVLCLTQEEAAPLCFSGLIVSH